MTLTIPMNLRDLPSVDLLLKHSAHLVSRYGRPLTYNALVWQLDQIRSTPNPPDTAPGVEGLVTAAEHTLQAWVRPSLQPVINATGVVLHTNLGRAPLSAAAIRAIADVGGQYANLEFDLADGKRGKRESHLASILRQLTGAEDSLVVNNCASAVLLALSALARGKQVLIPRSQLIEIGGGFRVPDVMKQSGAKLVEIGTTNKVNLQDFADPYAQTKDPERLLTFIAHRSNFKVIGFTEEPTLAQICTQVHAAGGVVLYDLGSGALVDTAKYGMQHEPTVQEALADGADLVLFSGDKLLGGPQAGLLVGKRTLLEKIKKHPLARAVRADKTTLAGLGATLLHYLTDEAEQQIPIWRSIAISAEALRARCEQLRLVVGRGIVEPDLSTVGGGSLPGETLPTWVWCCESNNLQSKLNKLRRHERPIIARVQQNKLVVDLRCVDEQEDGAVALALKTIFGD